MTNWKKGIALLLVVLLTIGLFAACGNSEPERGSEDEDDLGYGYGEVENGDEPVPAAPAEFLPADTVMIEIPGFAPVLWEEMNYEIQMMRHNLEMWGPITDWTATFDGNMDGEEISYADFIKQHVLEAILERRAVETLFEEFVGEEVGANIFAEARAHYLEAFGVDEAGFAEILEHNFLTENALRQLTESGYMRERLEEAFFAESDIEEAIIEDFIAENNVLRAQHILLMGSEDEEEDAAVLAEAMALYEELQGLSGDALFTRFVEMMQAYGEDPGMEMNPDGYVFMPEVMVAEFSNTTMETEIYEVAAPVRSGFGYHIILRLPVPLEATTMVMMPGGTPPMSFAQLVDARRFEHVLEHTRLGLAYTLTPAFEQLDLTLLFATDVAEVADEEIEEE